MSWVIGVDVGGTFTDFFARNERAGRAHVYKRPSTPDNPGRAITEGLRELCSQYDVPAEEIVRVCHGTTVATNALIQRAGSPVAMITTRGFRDLLEIGRQTRPHMFSLQEDHPPPLVPRERRFEIAERMLSSGETKVPLADDEVQSAVEAVRSSGAKACAVCLLFSYAYPQHEERIGQALRDAMPRLSVSLSSEVYPEFREYERFSTAVLNAYLQPLMKAYLDFLVEALAAIAPRAALGIYQSNGGLMSAERAGHHPVRTALSGPAAGVVGAAAVGRDSKRPDLITFDMGGTSTDVSLVRNFQTGIAFDRAVAGFPVRLPMVDVYTIGAGGGSIVHIGRDGLMKVGPESAGAEPGPACYGRGGTQATVTDANLVLGRLSPAGLAGGRVKLDTEAARASLKSCAETLKLETAQTALGVLGIVNANMVRAIRNVSVERGHDPRDYSLMPFGGAGPLHASDVARALGMREVVVPFSPGILCAEGLLVSDIKNEFVRSARFRLDTIDAHALREQCEGLLQKSEEWWQAESVPPAKRRLAVALDMRYVSQNFELTILLWEGGHPDPICWPDKDELERRFAEAHQRLYGFFSATDPIEIINARVTASGALFERASQRTGGAIDAASSSSPRSSPSAQAPRPIATRSVWFEGLEGFEGFENKSPVDTPVFDRARFEVGTRISGPAIIEQFDSTTVLNRGDELLVDEARSLVIAIRP